MYQFLFSSRVSSSRLPISGILIIPSFSGVLVFLFLGLLPHSLDVSSGKVVCGESVWRWQLLKACLAFCSSMDQDLCAGPCLHAAPARLSQVYVLAPEMPFQEDGLAPATFSQATEGGFYPREGGVVLVDHSCVSSWRFVDRGVVLVDCCVSSWRFVGHRHKPRAPNLFMDILVSTATTLCTNSYDILWLLHLSWVSSFTFMISFWFSSCPMHWNISLHLVFRPLIQVVTETTFSFHSFP